MYERYFNFRVKPFDLVPNPDFLFLSRTHQKVVTYLTYGLRERMGFMMLTGEVGSGKTTLIRYFIRDLDPSIPLAKVFNTKVSAEQLLAMINDDFGLGSRSRDKVKLIKQLYDFLIEEYSRGHQALLIIDEAQNLTPDLLEEIRMLSNLETNDTKLLQILMVGQPELGQMLSLPQLRQLRQRIGIVCHLYALSRKEMAEYISHRLAVAGNRGALTFTDEAYEVLYEKSGGIPRLINVICNLLLVTAYTEGVTEANREMVNDIVQGLEPPRMPAPACSPVERRKALLLALGIPVNAPADAARPAGQDPDPSERSIKDMIKDINMRIKAMERDDARIPRADIEDIRNRLVRIEQAQEKRRRDFALLDADERTIPAQENSSAQKLTAGDERLRDWLSGEPARGTGSGEDIRKASGAGECL
jgi:putative secretion ATPase (PEP-CTERM system associated)